LKRYGEHKELWSWNPNFDLPGPKISYWDKRPVLSNKKSINKAYKRADFKENRQSKRYKIKSNLELTGDREVILRWTTSIGQ
jgi:hypothetical protein